MKKILFFLICFFIAVNVLAEQFLVCDPDPVHVKYEIEGVADQPIIVDAIEHALRYNLTELEAKDYSLNVKALNEWGEKSDPAPFSFTRPQIPVVKNLRVVSP